MVPLTVSGFLNIRKHGKDSFDKYMKEYDAHQIEKVGKEMRKMMWPDSTE